MSYNVKAGDNLTKICTNHLKSLDVDFDSKNVRKLINHVAKTNGIDNPNLIKIGQKINLPQEFDKLSSILQSGVDQITGRPQINRFGEKVTIIKKPSLSEIGEIGETAKAMLVDASDAISNGDLDYAERVLNGAMHLIDYHRSMGDIIVDPALVRQTTADLQAAVIDKQLSEPKSHGIVVAQSR
jgi:hypothetical protein